MLIVLPSNGIAPEEAPTKSRSDATDSDGRSRVSASLLP
jgi:hypothetical protein